MRKLCLSALAVTAAISQAHALDSRMEAGLMELDPDTRLEQRCDTEVADRIAREDKRFAPDKVIAYATQEPKEDGDEIRTRGGAFRSKGEWYHVQVLSLRYTIGDKIPEDEWEQYNLYP
jgi:hypothetical protein